GQTTQDGKNHKLLVLTQHLPAAARQGKAVRYAVEHGSISCKGLGSQTAGKFYHNWRARDAFVSWIGAVFFVHYDKQVAKCAQVEHPLSGPGGQEYPSHAHSQSVARDFTT